MNKRVVLLILFAPAVLTACAIGYQARGSLSDVAGELRGKGYPGNAGEGGRFALANGDGSLQCDGQMGPADRSPTPGSCDGETGKGIVRCSDRREMAVCWTAITCRSFEGSGEDGAGNRLVFRMERAP